MSPVEDYCFEALRLFEGWQRSLSEETLQVWEQHLKNCALCQESTEIQAISEIWQELETLTVPEISSGFESDLLQQIQDLEQERLQRKNFWKHLDMWVDFLHVPAVAVVLTLLVWVGTSSS